MRRTKLFRATFLALACSATMVVSAQSNVAKPIDVPAGDLVSALTALAKQSGVEIIYRADQLKGVHTNGVRGTLSTDDALARILKGSGYGVRRDASGAIVIVKAAPAPPVLPKRAAEPVDSTRSVAVEEKIVSLPEILVQGSRSLNVDIPRTEDDIQPYVVFRREDLDLSPATNLEEFLSARLPMNQSRGTMSRNSPEDDKGNRSSFNLRGLGTNQTLILINGRRAPGVSTLLTGDLGQPDLNGYPLSAIERIEVLPATASGIYGGGATGGVINIILRKDYVGSEVRLSYDNTFDTDSARRRIDLSTGFTLANGRTNVMLSGSFNDGNDILVGDRDFAERGRQLMQENDPGQFAYWAVLGRQTNIFSDSSLVLRNGTPLGSFVASVPAGYAGGDGGVGLVSGAGKTDIGIPNTIAGARQSLSAVPTTKSFGVAIRSELSNAIDSYVDYGFLRNEGETKWAGFGNSVVLGPTAPGNPFKQRVTVSFPVYGDEFERSSSGLSETERLNAGLIFKLPSEWNASLDFNRSESNNTTRQEPSTLDLSQINAAVVSGALNVFRDLELYPLNLAPYMTDSLKTYGPGKGTLTELAIRVAGPALKLPAGDVRIAGLVSGRREGAGHALTSSTTQRGGILANDPVTTYRYLPSRHQDIRSFYLEATAPLVAPSMDISLIKSIEVQASFRRDEYATVSVPATQRLSLATPDAPIPPYTYVTNKVSSNDFTLGFRYQPSTSLTFRASVGTGFLPPSVSQVASSEQQYAQFLIDPKRGNVLAKTPAMLVVSGGSTEVKPEKSESFSAGLIYTPRFAPAIRISADYTRIEKQDEITTLTPQQILNLEEALPGRIVRGANLPGDPVGYAGVITKMDMTLFNTAASRAEAWDFTLDYDREFDNWGSLQVYGVATLQSELESQAVSTSPAVDRVGYADGPLKWRGNAGLVWKVGAWTTSFNTQWYDDYIVYASSATAFTRNQATRRQGSDRVDSQHYSDISTRYTFGSGPLQGWWISVGVRNVFNAAAPVLATYDSRAGYSTYGDPRLRTYAISLQRSF